MKKSTRFYLYFFVLTLCGILSLTVWKKESLAIVIHGFALAYLYKAIKTAKEEKFFQDNEEE